MTALRTGEITLAPLRWWHLPEVLVLEDELFAPENWSEELFWSELAQGPNRHYVVAFDGPQLVGYAGLATGGDEAYVQSIGVSGARQRAGIGALLLTDLIDEARTRGARTLGLEVRDDGHVAQRLYARHGFEAIGRRRGYYQPSNVDAVIMMRALP